MTRLKKELSRTKKEWNRMFPLYIRYQLSDEELYHFNRTDYLLGRYEEVQEILNLIKKGQIQDYIKKYKNRKVLPKRQKRLIAFAKASM